LINWLTKILAVDWCFVSKEIAAYYLVTLDSLHQS
jgi:hypothetical protein